MSSALKQRFGTLTVEEIEDEQEKLHNLNTTKNENKAMNAFKTYLTVADPGFPIGGALTRRGAPTSDAYTFWQKRKKLILLGGGRRRRPPPQIRQCLSQFGVENTDFFTCTQPELDKYLSLFWFNACTQDGDFYSALSMETLRYGLNHTLKCYGHQFDITKRECTSFTDSITKLEDAQKILKKMGKGHVKNYKNIKATCK